MDRIEIKDLMIRTVIGVSEEERRDKQDVVINVTLWADLRKAGETDSIDDTVNYRTINKAILAMAENSKFLLVEALAERIAAICLEAAGVQRVEVGVEKPGALRFARSVGVVVVRERGDA
jgi:dihydroneopterin aldolase/D-erythro-7,8-dihydroneopterin triphosphate epimerase